jgi:hypothetical protein
MAQNQTLTSVDPRLAAATSIVEAGAVQALRDDDWLAERVRLLMHIHFADVPQGYPIATRFGIRARNRFGSIGAQARQTIILVNRLFADPFVPIYVVDGTLAHELAHYAHGYGSGLPLLHRDPHRGGVVDKELDRRGLGEINRNAEQWRAAHWDAFYQLRCADLDARRAARQETTDRRWNDFLAQPGGRAEQSLRSTLSLLSPRFGFTEPPFGVEWLRASLRQTAPSYWFGRSCVVRVHGLLSDSQTPISMIEYEIGYWLARRAVGDNTHKIHRALGLTGLEGASLDAARWRRRAWNTFLARHHPLSAGNRREVTIS